MKNLFLLLILAFLQVSCHAQKEAIPVINQKSMQDFNYPYETKKIQLSDHLEIAYIDEGAGDSTLLMIHGLGSYLPAWKNNVEGLKHKYRCIAIDLPGYGKSSKGEYDFGMSFFAETLASFINTLNLENVILIGHSMGAQISVTMVLNTDAAIEKLVLIAPAGFEVFTEQNKAWFEAIFTPQMIKASNKQQLELNFAMNFAANTLPDDARFMYEDRLYMIETGTEYDAYAEMIPKCVMGMLNEPIFDRLSEIDIPTLVIYGEEDHLIPNKFLHPDLITQSVAESGQEQIPDSVLKMLTPCGHFVQWECAEEVNELLIEFIGQ